MSKKKKKKPNKSNKVTDWVVATDQTMKYVAMENPMRHMTRDEIYDVLWACDDSFLIVGECVAETAEDAIAYTKAVRQ